MWSFIVVDLKAELDSNSFLEFVNANFSDYEIIYCSSKKIENDSVKNYIFDNNTDTESILNTVVSKCTKKNLVVIRNVKNYQSMLSLTNCLERNNQIVFFKKNFSKFKRFWYKLMTKIVNWAFNQNMMPIFNDIVVYGETPSTVLKNISNPSILMRTNSFTGVEFTFIDGEVGSYRFKYSKPKAVLSCLIPLLISLVLIIIKATTKFKAIISVNLLYYAVILLGIMFFSLFGLIWFIKTKIGDNNSNKAKYL